MKDLFSKILDKVINEKGYFKIFAWGVIVIVLLVVILYPIIDANFLYYSRAKKRIEILQEISSIDVETINKDERISDEYNSILNDMSSQKENYTYSLIQQEKNQRNSIIKGGAASWIFILLSIIALIMKDDKTGKRFSKNNLIASVFCIIVGIALFFIGMKMPNIINIGVNVILYNIIVVFLIYTISKHTNQSIN